MNSYKNLASLIAKSFAIFISLQSLFISLCSLIFFISCIVYAESLQEESERDSNKEVMLKQANLCHNQESCLTQIVSDKEKLQRVENTLQHEDSVWLKRFDSFKSYHRITDEILKLEKANLESPLEPHMFHRLETLKRQQTLLEQYRNKPFGELLDKPSLEAPPVLTNPFGIFTALSYIKHIATLKTNLQNNKQELDKLIATIQKKNEILNDIVKIPILSDEQRKIYLSMLQTTQEQSLELQSAKNILATTIDVFDKDTDETEANLQMQIKNQIFKLGHIGIGILISVIIAFLLKLLAKKYIQHHERAYTTSKVINVINLTIIFFILLFAYIDNATYAVAMVGFASAGLAIAMKDMFMSTLGWLVIVVGGSIHVGDRIRIKKDNEILIGDVLDISMLRITIYDDITLPSYTDNHRAGRIIFIPNNYVFTNIISNYSYGNLTNVWDSVNICITFDSDITQAKKIALEVASKHAKIYTDQTRNQMRRMRDRFALAHSALNVDPRVFSIAKDYGIDISVWFQNYAFGTLKLRSIITQEIVEEFLKDSNISIAYPITRIVYDKQNGLGGANSFEIANTKNLS